MSNVQCREVNSSIRLLTWRGEHTRSRRKRMRLYTHCVRRKRAKDRECGSAYDGRFPVGWIKNSVLKRPRGQGNPLSRGTEGRPFRREGTHNAWGVCLLVCPIYTATASERTDVSRSFCPFYPHPPIFSLFLAHSLPLFRPRAHLAPRILAWTSPRCIVRPFEWSQPIGAPHDDFIMKKRNVRVDRTPLRSARGEVKATGRDRSGVRLRVPNVYRLADEKNRKERTKMSSKERKSERVILPPTSTSCRP